MKIEEEKRYVLSITVQNVPGALARVVGMFTGRGYNIESLNVTTINKDKSISRINIVSGCTEKSIEQIKKQLNRIISVEKIEDFHNGEIIEKEIALIKFEGEDYNKALQISSAIGARTLEISKDRILLVIEGDENKITQFIDLLSILGRVEINRSGTVVISNKEIDEKY